MTLRQIAAVEVGIVLVVATQIAEAKERSWLVSAEMRANAQKNIKRYDWARKEQEKAIEAAQPWVKLSDEALWELVTSQELPRGIFTNKEDGCPNCGNGIFRFGSFPWKFDRSRQPWKIRCPNCKEVYPKNDFLAFYKTALDAHGMFRRKLGDRRLLFNAEHPNPKDPLHKIFVDDGYGMRDRQGRRHRAIAYYGQWARWRGILGAVQALARAYTLTEDKRYAHKAAVLLDRIADVYPEMDFKPLAEMGFEHSHGGSRQGRIQGRIWEARTGNAVARGYDWAFDGIKDDRELVRFCSRKAAKYKLGDKGSLRAIFRHIEDNLLREVLKSVRDGRLCGNTGHHQNAYAYAAIALDRPELTNRYLDFLFDPQFPGKYRWEQDSIPWVLTEGLDRDGMGGECGGYGLKWTGGIIHLAEMLAKYPRYSRRSMIREFPKMKQCFLAQPRMNCLDRAFPPIGDSGTTGQMKRTGDVRTFMQGFKLYGDPRMASLAWHFSGHDASKFRGSIYDAEPLAIVPKLIEAAKKAPFRIRSEHLGRYGQAILQTEKPANGRAVWIHYGYAKGHSHSDSMNLGLYAKNIDMLPDLGYPEFTAHWPKRFAWTEHRVSHNTVMINDKSRAPLAGKIQLFAVNPPVRLIDVASPNLIEGVTAYRRSVTMVDVSEIDSYVFDVFRVRGGANHRMSWHGPSSKATATGLSLQPQGPGTFAGRNVKFAEFYDGAMPRYQGSGFMYLYDVERSGGPVRTPYTVDWRAEDTRGYIRPPSEPHLRLHALTPCDEVALASGDPPQNKRNAPRRLRYLMQSRLGTNVTSQFVNVLEPYDGKPFIRRVRRLDVRHDGDPHSVAAVVVELASGATDILIQCEQPTRIRIGEDIEFDGVFAMARLVDGRVTRMRMSHARLLKVRDATLRCPTPAYTGKVVRIDAGNPEDHRVYLSPPLPKDPDLIGKAIHFENAVPYDTTYDITAAGGEWISTGEITIIAGFKDPTNFKAGYKYLVNPGDQYVLPISVALDR